LSKRTIRHEIFRARVFTGALGHGFCGDFECKTRAERAFLLQNCGEQGTQNIEPAVTISYLIQRERILRWPRDSIMLGVTIQDLGEMAVIRCVGRIVAGREANTLREALLSQPKRRAVVSTSLVLMRSTAAEWGRWSSCKAGHALSVSICNS